MDVDKTTVKDDEDNLSPRQPGQLDLGSYLAGNAEDLPRGSGATDHVRMLGVVQHTLENAEHAVTANTYMIENGEIW
jgi:hypothetical protein